MTGPLAYARADLAAQVSDLLGDQVPVHTAMPTRIAPPCVILAEQSPLIEPADTADTWTVHLEAVALVPAIASDLAVPRLDTLADTLVLGLAGVTSASYATLTAADGQTYLIARIATDTHLTITKE